MSEASNNFDMNLLKRGAKAFQKYVDTSASNLENIPRTNFIGNAALGVAQYGMPLLQMVAHPIQTAENLGYAAQHIPETANTIIEQQKQYYSPKNFKQNFYNDPVKPLRDVADIANTVQIAKDVANVAKTVNNTAKIIKDVKNIENTTQAGVVGSPVKFDKFSKEAIGTGEGNSVHGYGFYANKQNPTLNPTAMQRAEKYANLNQPDRINLPDEFTPLERSMIIEDPKNADWWIDNKLKEYSELLRDSQYTPFQHEHFQNKIEELGALKNQIKSLINESKGSIQDVRMPKENVMLNEKNIMASQPEVVRNAQSSFISRQARDISKDYNKFKDFINSNDIDINKAFGEKYTNNAFDKVGRNPQLLEPHLRSELKTGKDFYKDLTNYFGSKKAASEWLDSHGVKGISYKGGLDLDANVIFNEANIYNTPEWYLQRGGLDAVRYALDNRLEIPEINAYPYIYTIAQPNYIKDFNNRINDNGKI